MTTEIDHQIRAAQARVVQDYYDQRDEALRVRASRPGAPFAHCPVCGGRFTICGVDWRGETYCCDQDHMWSVKDSACTVVATS